MRSFLPFLSLDHEEFGPWFFVDDRVICFYFFSSLPLKQTTRERILFFVAGIAFLTLIVNGPTTPILSKLVGLTQETAAQRDVVREARELVSHKLLAKYTKSLRKYVNTQVNCPHSKQRMHI